MNKMIYMLALILCLGAGPEAVQAAADAESPVNIQTADETAAATGETAAVEENAAATKDESAAEPAEKQTMAEQWGVKVESLRVTANGHLLDFRYRILDPEKAVYLVDRTNKAYLIDQESGKVMAVPNTAKVGPLRQTVRYGLPKKDRIYFVLFGNALGLKAGNRVTVVIGDFKAENLVIE